MQQADIRAVELSDIDECVDVIRKAFLPKAIQYGFTKENYPTSGAFIERETLLNLLEKESLMFAVWFDNKIVGYFQLLKKDEKEYLFQKFAVLPEYQQFGLGKTMVNFAKCTIKALGVEKISLIMINDNIELKKFYISSGFCQKSIINNEKYPFEQALMCCEV